MSLNVDTSAVLLIDAENAFNTINQKVMNVKERKVINLNSVNESKC